MRTFCEVGVTVGTYPTPWAPRRHVYLDGMRAGVPTRLSLVLCMMFGPLGLLAHLITRARPFTTDIHLAHRSLLLVPLSLVW